MDITECGSKPCQNGGTCIDQINVFSCNCAPGFTGDTCSTTIQEYNLIKLYCKLLYEVDETLPPIAASTGHGSWLLPGAGAEMTIQQMGKRASWAFNYYPSNAASTISAAWRSLEMAVVCFYHARNNPQMYRFKHCLTPLDAASQSISILHDMLYVGNWGAHMWDEHNLLVQEFNVVIGFQDSISSQLQRDFSAQIDSIETIQDPEEQEIAKLNLFQSHTADFASAGSVQSAVHNSQQNLNIVRGNKAIEQAYKRFEKASKALWQSIEQDPNNEALWVQYLSLLDGEDAWKGLTPESLRSLKTQAGEGLQDAKENKRMSRLFEQYQEQEGAIISRLNTAPIEARQDLIALLNSEPGQSLSTESREAMLIAIRGELESLL